MNKILNEKILNHYWWREIGLETPQMFRDRLVAKLNEIMSHHTGQPIERIERDTDRDNFLSAQDAAEYGLIDKVLADRSAV